MDVDLTAVVRNLAAGEVERAFEPYRAALERLNQFLGLGATPSASETETPGADADEDPTAFVPAPNGFTATETVSATVLGIREGDAVKFKAGRAEIGARVLKIDAQARVATLKSENGKLLERALDKLAPA